MVILNSGTFRLFRQWLPALALCCAATLALWSLRGLPAHAQGSTLTIRPSTYVAGATIGAPANAIDNNDSTTAGNSVTHVCYTNCMTITNKTATWLGVAAGYHPIRLETHWQGAAAAALYGNDTSRVEVKLEYSLDGGNSWSSGWDSEAADYVWTGASPACSNNGITCTNHVSTLALSDLQATDAIQVRATMTVQLPHCDNCTLRVSNNGGQIWIYDIRVIVDNCEIPIGETTDAVGWHSTAPYRTAYDFQQTLTPPGANSCSGRIVKEIDPVPGGGATDTCYFTGSAVAKVTSAVSGGQWTVDSSNSWGIDTVGWLESGANYYQANALDLPCYVTGPQRMLISCQTQTTFVPYIENTLEDGVLLPGAVSSQRQSNYQQRIWP